ncbi:hypothetical protein NQ317_004087 [Molorchus minor]|uniref:Uncharacterized protein n=1 Tax=Molorchus minor TaxID=1323400 RepID=A0ABQ9JUH8_9CUCU|nr:hypothetical protein NQ317_004087 [Molorchus minor]
MAKYKLKIKLKVYQCTPKDPPYSTIRWLIQRRACPGQFMSSAADRGLNWTESRSRALKKRWMAGNSTASSQSDVTCRYAWVVYLQTVWSGYGGPRYHGSGVQREDSSRWVTDNVGWPEVNDPTIFRDTFLSWDLD